MQILRAEEALSKTLKHHHVSKLDQVQYFDPEKASNRHCSEHRCWSGRTCLLVELCVELDGGFAALQPNRTPVRDGLDLHTVAAVDLKTLQIHGAPDLNQQKKKPVIKLSHQNYITV